MADSAAPLRSAFWPSFWMAVVLFGAKAIQWSLPEELTARRLGEYATDLGASAHADVFFAAVVGVTAQVVLSLTSPWPKVARAVRIAIVAFGVVCVTYAVASVQIFAYLRSPLTYPLIYLAGDMRDMRSSLGSFVNAKLVAAFLVVPLLYVAAVLASEWRVRWAPAPRLRAALGIFLLAGIALAHHVADGKWSDRADHLIALSPHWALVVSFAEALTDAQAASISEPFPAEHLLEFEGGRPARPAQPKSWRPRNLILVVLESTGARWLSLYGSKYATTPVLDAEAAHALVFDNFYCHVGLTANSMAAISLSIFPYMTWREYTQEYPKYPGKTLADVFHALGRRTAFLHSGDLRYVGQDQFLQNRGFEVMQDVRDLSPDHQVSSWGGEDRILVDGLFRWIDKAPHKPFYVMAWTIQSHHPYEPSPGQEPIDFFHGDVPPDDYDLGRYLNTVHEVDRQLGRLFDGLRRRGLAEETLVAITGDHGECFGDPHRTWGHGARVYQEGVNVPFILWNPRLYPKGQRAATIGGHVDVNPTLLDVMGLPPVKSWQGRSLFDPGRAPRTYFYAANDDYLFGVREANWKYIYNATRAKDELYDLGADPTEQADVSEAHPELCQRLRQHLAAWRDYAARELKKNTPQAGLVSE
jgi:phosphoglycerol transferase MdoB-like AlkP superfamily enzyme